MSTPTDPRPEHPSTYFVQDRSNQEELIRLGVQDQMITASMGGALPEQADPTIFQRILDVGCGTGGWLIEAAKTYPSISRLEGVDVSRTVVEFAREQAVTQQVSDRVEFHTMDALRMLEFPNHTFDLVNQRSGAGYLRTWDWTKLLQEYRRITRPGGVLRITEGDWVIESNSPALSRLFDLLLLAFSHAGHSFTPTSDGVTNELERLLQRFGFQDIQIRPHPLEYRAGSEIERSFIEDMKLVFRTIVPFLRKWTRLPEDYDTLYRQMLGEIQQPDFVARGRMLTVWGTNGSGQRNAFSLWNERESRYLPGEA